MRGSVHASSGFQTEIDHKEHSILTLKSDNFSESQASSVLFHSSSGLLYGLYLQLRHQGITLGTLLSITISHCCEDFLIHCCINFLRHLSCCSLSQNLNVLPFGQSFHIFYAQTCLCRLLQQSNMEWTCLFSSAY